MGQVIKYANLKDQCSLFKKDIIDVSFEECIFDHLILSDINLVNVCFSHCKFDHVFVESFYACNILIRNSHISSLSLRAARKITGKRLFSSIKVRKIERVSFDNNTTIEELVLGGNLEVVNCDFPKGENYLHFKRPIEVYNNCLDYINNHWEGERRRVGLTVIGDYISKGVEAQNEDFIVFSDNENLNSDINEILKSVFLLVKKFSQSM